MSATADVAADLVLEERRDGIAVLTLNRPDRMNAWTTDLGRRLSDLLDAAERDAEVRVVILTGAGRAFCAGADLEDLAASADAGEAEMPMRATRPLTMRKPVLAALNGACAGLGLAIALAADRRFATPHGKLTTAFARRGLIAEHGLSWTLPRLVGRARAADLLLSGRAIQGAEALALGLVDVVADDPLAAALEYARELIEQCSPRAMAVIKAQLLADDGASLAEAMGRAERLTALSLRWPDVNEGVQSYLERRPPQFPPLAFDDDQETHPCP